MKKVTVLLVAVLLLAACAKRDPENMNAVLDAPVIEEYEDPSEFGVDDENLNAEGSSDSEQGDSEENNFEESNSDELDSAAEGEIDEETEYEGEEIVEEEVVSDSDWITDSKYAAKDLQGRNFRFAYSWQVTPGSSDLTPDPSVDNEEYIERYINLRRVEEKYNCTIEYLSIPATEQDSMLVTTIMAGDPFDVYNNLSSSKTLINAAKNNIITAIDDLRPASDDMFKPGEEKVLSVGMYNGKHYFITNASQGVKPSFIGVNLDIISKLELKNPVDLFNEGIWTFEEFKNLAIAATVDTTGGTVIDTWGFSGSAEVMTRNFLAANDGFFLNDAENSSGFNDSKTVNALDFVRSLYSNGLVYHTTDENWAANFNENAELWREGKTAMFDACISMFEEAPSFDYNIVAYPIGPDNTSGSTFSVSNVNGAVISKAANQPKDIIMVFEEINARLKSETGDGSLDRAFVAVPLKHTEDEARIRDLMKTYKVDNFRVIEDWPISSIVSDLYQNGKSAAQTVSDNQSKVQNAINKVFGQ